MSGALRWWIWGAVAVGAAAALWYAPPPDDTPATPARPAVAAATGSRSGAPVPPALRLPAAPVPAAPDDARRFAAMWQLAATAPAAAASQPVARSAPPPPTPVAATAAPPAALTWPYRLLGRWRDGERDAVILQGPDGQVAIASQGDTLPSDWRIDTVVANTLVYSHVPSGQRQTLDLGFAR